MKLIVRKTGTIFDFCESSNGTDYDGQIYGGSSVKLSYTNDTLKVIVDGGEANSYPLADLNYDDGSEIIGFATMLEFIEAVKGAGFTGNFNTGGATPQYSNDETIIGTFNGKTLYAKVIPFALGAEDTEITITHNLNIERYLKHGVLLKVSEYGNDFSNFYQAGSVNSEVFALFDNSIYISGTFLHIYDTLILEYTKITD